MWPGTVLSTSQIPIHLIQKKKTPKPNKKPLYDVHIFGATV